MSAPAPLDILLFAQSGGSLRGELRADELPRLRDNLTSEDVAVQYRLSGGTESGRPVLRLDVSGYVWLTCQRCLELYQERFELRNALPIARDESELARWEEEDPLVDALVAETRLDVVSLVEDEILLSLPVVPRHPDGACGMGYQA
jgi:uncharacterized protein